MQRTIEPTRNQLAVLILIFGILLGAFIRFQPTLAVGFPVTDGGLFYVITSNIKAGNYALPEAIAYNGFEMPFVYPPFGFYLTAIISDVFQMPLLEAFRWLPALGSVLVVLAYYVLAAELLKSQFKGMIAAILFALLPRSVSWFVMGGGITRVPGLFFMILTIWSVYRLFTAPSKKNLGLTILFASGVVLSHPEAALHAVFFSLVLWLFHGRTWQGIRNAGITALGVLTLTLPFFAVVLSRHGVQPFLNAAQTGFHSSLAWLYIFIGSFADEKFVTLISALAMLGLVLAVLKRDYLLIMFLFLPAIVDPRSAPSFSTLAWAMLAANAFVDVVLPGVYALTNKSSAADDFDSNWHVYFLKSGAVKLVLTGLIFYSFFTVGISNQVYLKLSLTASDREAMNWVSTHIAPQSRFVIVTGEPEAFADAFSEWFPALSGSISLATVQGYEWLPGFQEKLNDYASLQTCANGTVTCVADWSSKNDLEFDYILLSQDDLIQNGSPLLASLNTTAEYELVYESGDVAIFKSGK